MKLILYGTKSEQVAQDKLNEIINSGNKRLIKYDQYLKWYSVYRTTNMGIRQSKKLVELMLKEFHNGI